jgi:hypothetical protein
MSTEEDLAFERIMDRLRIKRVTVLSAHPPSGKAYDTELIRIPARAKHAGRYHLDAIFVLDEFLFLMELKGRLSESSHDITKLQGLLSEYSLADILKFVRKRVNRADVPWETIKQVVPSLGCILCDCSLPADFVVVESKTSDLVRCYVGNSIFNKAECQSALTKVFDSV